MRKLGITTIASFAVNVILSLWLVNQYFYDVYFHSYVDATLGPVYPFIVLTAGLGGGSSLGYLLLKRRRGGDETGRLEKAKLFKSSGPMQTPGSLASQGKIMPTGPPPGQVSRHTAYAVPPLPKSTPSAGSGSRGAVPSSMGASSKTAASSTSMSQSLDRITQPSTSILNSTLRDQYRPEPTARPLPSVPLPSAPAQASQTPFPVSKWVPPDQRGGQWTDPVPKPGLAAPQKWALPPGQGVGPRPPPQGGPPRPGSAPVPGPAGQRPPFPPSQGPRPLGYPPGRPGQPGPLGVAPPFRSDQPRTRGPPSQARPVQSPGGPLPQPWSPSRPAEKGDVGGGSRGR